MDFHATVKQLNAFRQHLSRCIQEEEHPEWGCPCRLCAAAKLARQAAVEIMLEHEDRKRLTEAVLDEEWELVPAGHEHELGGEG